MAIRFESNIAMLQRCFTVYEDRVEAQPMLRSKLDWFAKGLVIVADWLSRGKLWISIPRSCCMLCRHDITKCL